MITDKDLQQLADYLHKTEIEIKDYSYTQLENLKKQMLAEKAKDAAANREISPEFTRLVKKYFTLWNLLTCYWTEDEVLKAVARHMNERDLTSEVAVRKGNKCWQNDAEYVCTKQAFIPRFSKEGEQLMQSEYCTCDIYRVKNPYQHLHQAKVVEKLLYDTFPELKEFQFSIYGCQYNDRNAFYEIYPKNNIYTPFRALLEGNIDAIKNRNREYAKAYNHGVYTVQETEKRLKSEAAAHYFDVIRNMDRRKLISIHAPT